MTRTDIYWEGDTAFGHYQVVDTIYNGRPARVLYSGDHLAAQSGVAFDGRDELLFDYNQRFIELIRGLKPRKILLLGGGAFTLPLALMKEFPGLRLDVVEIDAGLLNIAKNYFDFQPSERVRVHIDDAWSYVRRSAAVYDMIVVDTFVHAVMPDSLQTEVAARSFRQRLRPSGVLALNIIAAYHGERSWPLRHQVETLQNSFQTVKIFPAEHGLSPWLSQNFVLTAQNTGPDLAQFLRYAELELPTVS